MYNCKYISTAAMLFALLQISTLAIAQQSASHSSTASSVAPLSVPISTPSPTELNANAGSAIVDRVGDAVPALPLNQSYPTSVSSSEDSKRDLGGYGNVISAFLGAFLTFLATQYNAKQNWERKKSEQLRDKQFGKLSEAARALDFSSVVLSNACSKLEMLVRREGAQGGLSGVVEAELQALGRQGCKDVSQSLRALKLAIIDLQICRAHGVPIETCFLAQKELEKASNYFETLASGGSRQDYTIVESASEELVRLSETFATAALDSLAG